MYPNLLGIGSQRCGSTSMYEYLVQHPKIHRNSFGKETHWFDWRYGQGDWYTSKFHYNEGEYALEFTPGYMYHPGSVSRIARDIIPPPKFIALLRDPVDRAYSHWARGSRVGRDNLPFMTAITTEEKRIGPIEGDFAGPIYTLSYKARGRYFEQLERWFSVFSRETTMVIQSERLYDAKQTVMNEVFDWLGLDHHPIKGPAFEQGTYPPIGLEEQAYLIGYFRPHNEKLFDLLGVDFAWKM